MQICFSTYMLIQLCLFFPFAYLYLLVLYMLYQSSIAPAWASVLTQQDSFAQILTPSVFVFVPFSGIHLKEKCQPLILIVSFHKSAY